MVALRGPGGDPVEDAVPQRKRKHARRALPRCDSKTEHSSENSCSAQRNPKLLTAGDKANSAVFKVQITYITTTSQLHHGMAILFSIVKAPF